MKTRTIRKNAFIEKDHLTTIEEVAATKFGSKSRYSRTLNYILERFLPQLLEECSQYEAQRLQQNQMALQMQKNRLAANEIGETFKQNHDEAFAW